MVKHNAHELDYTFAALADPTRRAILGQLAEGSVAVSELAEPFEMSLPAVSKHLRVLERAGLVIQVKEGRTRHCHLVAAPIRSAAEWISRYQLFWEGKLDALAQYLETSSSTGEVP